MFLQLYINIGI